MSVVVGVRPGGRNKFAVACLYWPGKLPASLVECRVYSGVDEVAGHIVGLTGEWGQIDSLALDAPLSWSGSTNGWRSCDLELKKFAPEWFPKTWLKPSNNLPGSQVVQGPALIWSLAKETKVGTIPKIEVIETHSRASLALTMRDKKEAILGYRQRGSKVAERLSQAHKLINRFIDTGILKMETDLPHSEDAFEALVCSVVALGVSHPESGLQTQMWMGGDIRPVGTRSLAVLSALP